MYATSDLDLINAQTIEKLFASTSEEIYKSAY